MHSRIQKFLISFPICLALACTTPEPKAEIEVSKSKNSRYYVVSLDNDPMLLHTIPQAGAQKLRKKIESQKKQNTETLRTRIALGRWSHAPFATLKKEAGQLVELEMRKGVERDIADAVKFDLAVAAYYSEKWAEMLLLLDGLATAKDKRVLALLADFRGVLAWQDGRIPEAGIFFQEALSLDAKNEGALLNLAFLNLKFGYAEEADKYLAKVPDDSLALSGRIISAQMQGKAQDASRLCDRFLKTAPTHKPTLLNCAQVAYYDLKDAQRAQTLLEKFTRLPGGEKEWNQEATKLLNSLKSAAKVSKAQK